MSDESYEVHKIQLFGGPADGRTLDTVQQVTIEGSVYRFFESRDGLGPKRIYLVADGTPPPPDTVGGFSRVW